MASHDPPFDPRYLSCFGSFSHAQDEAPADELIFKTDWKGERIVLPPKFAPDMKLTGVEEIRFAPGMFKPESETFFTYVFVFALSGARSQ